MKRSRGALMLFILPTETLFVGSDSADELLSKVEASLKTIVEAVILRWSQMESGWAEGHALPTDSSILECVEASIIEDFVSDPLGEHASWLSDEDRHDLHTLIHGMVVTLFEEIIPIFDDLHLNTYQLQTLKPLMWLGKSLVVDLVV